MLDLILILNIGKAKPPLVLPPAPLMASFSCWNQAAFISSYKPGARAASRSHRLNVSRCVLFCFFSSKEKLKEGWKVPQS